jgi:DNA-binding PadR family transcriptional regulator
MFDNQHQGSARRGHGHGHGEDHQGFFGPFWGEHHRPGMPHHPRGGEERRDFSAPAEAWFHAMFSAMFGEHPGGGEDRAHRGGPQGGGRGSRGGLHGGGPGGGGFGGGPRRPERLLEQGDLRWLVLDLIATQPRHGYEIIKAIEDMLSGHYTPSPGVIYPTLTYLEETGLITGETQGAKKLYSITEEGRAALSTNSAAVQALRTRIEAIRTRFGDESAPELRRAMGNLRTAIQIRLSKGELSPESLSAITAAIDRAASEIERS